MPSDPPKQRVRDIPARSLTVRVWHHCPPDVPLLSVLDPPPAEGRWHRKRGRPAWYAASRERGAWAEYFRHLNDPVNPFFQTRKVGRAFVEELAVLDLTDPDVRERLGVTKADLTSDVLTVCQRLAEEARDAGFDGILAPSAAMKGEQTLIVFRPGLRKLKEEHSRVQHPPVSLLDMLRRMVLKRPIKNVLQKLRILRRRGKTD